MLSIVLMYKQNVSVNNGILQENVSKMKLNFSVILLCKMEVSKGDRKMIRELVLPKKEKEREKERVKKSFNSFCLLSNQCLLVMW